MKNNLAVLSNSTPRITQRLQHLALGFTLFVSLATISPSAFCQSANAVSADTSSPWRVLAGVGIGGNRPGTRGQDLVVTHTETDVLEQTRQSNPLAYMLGAWRSFSLRGSGSPSSWDLGLVMYHQVTHFQGSVWQYGLAGLNYYHYQYRVSPYTLYAEGAVTLSPLGQRVYPEAFAGIGVGSIKLSYRDSAQAGVPKDSELSGSQWRTRLVYELGLGLRVALTGHWSLGARYVYQFLGQPSVLVSSKDGALRADVPVKLHNQSGYLVLSYAL